MTVVTRSGERGGMVYVQGFTPQPALDMKAQTRRVLARIEELLKAARTSKSKLLAARVLLADMNLFADYDSVWNEWVDPQCPPLRVCRPADPAVAGGLLDVTVTATRAKIGL